MEKIKLDKVKNIVDVGLFQGYAKDNIISQIMYEIANKEELQLLSISWDIPQLKDKAEKLFEKYRKEYYKIL